jgi:hypothetical protein
MCCTCSLNAANDISEIIDKWFAMVQSKKGEVQVESDPEHMVRGYVSEGISQVTGAHKIIKKMLHDPNCIPIE